MFNCICVFSVLNSTLRRVHQHLKSISTHEDDKFQHKIWSEVDQRLHYHYVHLINLTSIVCFFSVLNSTLRRVHLHEVAWRWWSYGAICKIRSEVHTWM